jgi:hypothetical protein
VFPRRNSLESKGCSHAGRALLQCSIALPEPSLNDYFPLHERGPEQVRSRIDVMKEDLQ